MIISTKTYESETLRVLKTTGAKTKLGDHWLEYTEKALTEQLEENQDLGTEEWKEYEWDLRVMLKRTSIEGVEFGYNNYRNLYEVSIDNICHKIRLDFDIREKAIKAFDVIKKWLNSSGYQAAENASYSVWPTKKIK